MSDRPCFAVGGRAVPRPVAVRLCLACGELAGRGYPGCPDCAAAVDAFWRTGWATLRAEHDGVPEPALAERVVAADVGAHPWTCVDHAMSMIDCPSCGAALGTGPVGCVLCRIADETRWAWEHLAPPGAITPNEHALRTARVVLRAPHRHRATVVLTWRLALPFLLTGEVTEPAQVPWLTAYLRAGRYDELAAAGSFTQLTGTPDLPWR
jgi:hypothetical protein